MTQQTFDYEDVFMGAREGKPKTYFRTFSQDYRLRSLTSSIRLGKGKLLDIGSGGGLLTESLPYYYPHGKIYGCDVSKTAITYAKKFGSGKVKYSLIKNKQLPYKDNSFDVCICLDVLEHVPDVQYFLKEVRRVLKKNGTFFLVVPCEGQIFTYTWFLTTFRIGQDLTYKQFGHIHPEFTHKYVGDILKKKGFFIKKIRYSEHALYQCMHLFLFTLPKLLLETFLGKKSNEYTNSSLIRSPKKNTDFFMVIRKYWFALFYFMMMNPMYWETVVLERVPFTAWKLHVIAKNQK